MTGPQGISVESFKDTQLNDDLLGIDGRLDDLNNTLKRVALALEHIMQYGIKADTL